MKVLTILSKLEMGGIEKTLLSCLPYLNRMGIEISVLCDEGGKLQPEYEMHGVEIVSFNGLKKPFLEAKRLAEVLVEGGYDLVHSRAGHTSGEFAKVCKKFQIPLLVSIHNEKAMFRNSWKGKPILGGLRQMYLIYHKRLTIKHATFIVGHSQANLEYFSNIPYEYSNKLKVLYNGVDFEKFKTYPPLSKEKQRKLSDIRDKSSKIFIHIGKFKEQKNHGFMLEVFSRLKPKDNGYYLILLGEGPLIEEIRRQVCEKDLEQYVWFVGMETNIAPYLATSDVFLFPSIYEGFGNVLIEAQYAGLAIAASSIKPHYEATHESYHRFLFDPNNVEDAERKINKLLDSDLLDVKNEAYKFASLFSIENMVDNLITLYNKSIDIQ